ncbi:MAG TPA: S41 family peptidase [Pyrinomonadaceae bacterium]|jgi:C-terminal processing protease CtpA/Prc
MLTPNRSRAAAVRPSRHEAAGAAVAFIAVALSSLLLALATPAPASAQGQSENERKAQRLVAAIQSGDADGGTAYDAACYFALAGKTDEAFRYLEQAVERGFANPGKYKSDPDLAGLHQDPRWPAILEKAAAKEREQQSAFWNRKEFWDNPTLQTPYRENLSAEEKLAGLAKFWSEVKYNFANFDLVPDLNWDAALLEFIPKVQGTRSTLEYYQVLQEMCARLRDGHTNVSAPHELDDELYTWPQVRTRLIENHVIVAGVSDALRRDGIEVGQEVVEVNGLPVRQYAEQKVKPYTSSSTPQDLEMRLYESYLFMGSAKEPIELTLRDEQGRSLKKTVRRLTREQAAQASREAVKSGKTPTPPFEWKMLPGEVAYVKLNTFADAKAADMFAAAFDEIAASKAMIIDLRNNSGGDSGVGWRILGYLTDKPFKTSKWDTRQYRPAFRAWGRAQETYGKEAGEYQPEGKKHYARPVVVLTGPRTFSAAEDFMVSYVTMKRGLTVGEPTGGSTGQPLYFSLPGGGGAVVCSKRDRFPDGRDFVGKGVQPDVLVRPTLADFRTKRDTVLEAALKELK